MASWWRNVPLYWKTIVTFATPVVFSPLPIVHPEVEWKCAFAVLIMATFWVTEALPLPVTALLPVVLFPLLGVMNVRSVSMAYFKDTNMVFLGSVIVAVSIEHCNLHKRIALGVLRLMGTSPKGILFGFMTSTWFLSMWICNTSATAMMVPVAAAVLTQIRQGMLRRKYGAEAPVGNENPGFDHHPEDITLEVNKNGTAENKVTPNQNEVGLIDEIDEGDADMVRYRRFCRVLTLSVAYAANAGGIGTLTGAHPNLVLKNMADNFFEARGVDSPLTYASWMAFAIPVAAICLLVAWLLLTIMYSGLGCLRPCQHDEGLGNDEGVRKLFRDEYKKLGSISFAEISNIILFTILIMLWLTRDPGFTDGWGSLFKDKYVSDSVPPILISVFLFILPAKFPKCGENREALLDWQTLSRRVPWGPFFLLGGAFAMADACKNSGLSAKIGIQLVKLDSLPDWVIVLLIAALVATLTEVTSNAATTSLLLPIVSSMALQIGLHPLYLMIPTTVAASFAFMLPVATPPNAIVFSYGHLRVIDMAMVGIFMNVACVLILTAAVELWGKPIFDLDNLPWNNSTASP